MVTGLSGAVRAIGDESGETHSHPDDGTPIEGVIAAAPALPVIDGSFVAGEIDVPTPPPKFDDVDERITEREKRDKRESRDMPAVEFTAASGLLGASTEAPEPDTGSRTPPIERR